MLVVARKPGTGVTIGADVRVVVRSITGRTRVKLGIEAPQNVRVVRDELGERVEAAPRGDFRVVVIEDDPAHLRMIRGALKRAGVTEVRTETRGRTALASFAEAGVAGDSAPDLIMLDLMLPDVSGLDVLRAVRAQERLRFIPVVVLSSSESPASVSECLDAGANAFLVKEARYDAFCHSVGRIASFWREARRVA